MPSKKKLRKQIRKLERHNRAWSGAVNQRDRELQQLRDAARELVHALDDGRQDDIPTRKDAVRDLLPGDPWTLGRIMKLRYITTAMAEALIQPIDRDIIERDGKWGDPTWVTDEQMEAEREAAERYARKHNHRFDRAPLCHETMQPDGQLRGECMREDAA